MRIKAAHVFIADRFVQNQALIIDQGLIQSVAPAEPHAHFDLTLNEDCYLLPGMIDLHIHGANGADVMDATPEALATISQALARDGVTGFLATTMTASQEKIEAALNNVCRFENDPRSKEGAEILGLHLEGPFLSEAFVGAQSAEHLKMPDPELLIQWQTLAQGKIKILTLAPELHKATELIHTALTQNIIPSIGHAAATYEETLQAIESGACYATHLFNAMSGLHHRNPGAALALLEDDRVTAELILDGLHLAPSIVRLALKCKGLERLVFVTDAMRAKCLKNGEYDLGGQTVILKNDAARLKSNGALAGSVLSLNQALKNACDYTGLELARFVPSVTSTPARILGLSEKIGNIALYKHANFAILNKHFEVQYTLREGRVIYDSHL